MARSMWRGAISFGMVSIPVRLYLAADSGPTTAFRQLCGTHQAPIHNRRWCTAGDHEVQYSELVKGFEVSPDSYVVIGEEDLERLPLATTHTIEISQFLPQMSIAPGLYFKAAYYVEPEGLGKKPHALLQRALSDSGTLALAKIALREREHLAALQPSDGGLLLNTLRWPEEVRSTAGLNYRADETLSAPEVTMARQLVRSLTRKSFEPAQLHDGYRQAVERMVEEKLAGHEPVPANGAQPANQVVDLMEALRASIDAAQKTRASERGTGTDKAKRSEKRIAL
ncbi:MAG: Ku protein [Candidatus Dormibacteraceae bacterium]